VERALERLGTDLRVQYGQNLLHAFLADFIDVNGETIADYYLGFPAMQGVSLILHA
jgi:hypothetical protein